MPEGGGVPSCIVPRPRLHCRNAVEEASEPTRLGRTTHSATGHSHFGQGPPTFPARFRGTFGVHDQRPPGVETPGLSGQTITPAPMVSFTRRVGWPVASIGQSRLAIRRSIVFLSTMRLVSA